MKGKVPLKGGGGTFESNMQQKYSDRHKTNNHGGGLSESGSHTVNERASPRGPCDQRGS